MRWQVHAGDLLDVSADVLICSANVYLTLSGGVGGSILVRYGDEMQEALDAHLATNQVKYVPPGSVVAVDSCGTPYRKVLHAVAVDALYQTSVELVRELIAASLQVAAEHGARNVALAALATGYGRQSLDFFADALREHLSRDFAPIECVTIGVKRETDAEELRTLLPELQTYAAAGK